MAHLITTLFENRQALKDCATHEDAFIALTDLGVNCTSNTLKQYFGGTKPVLTHVLLLEAELLTLKEKLASYEALAITSNNETIITDNIVMATNNTVITDNNTPITADNNTPITTDNMPITNSQTPDNADNNPNNSIHNMRTITADVTDNYAITNDNSVIATNNELITDSNNTAITTNNEVITSDNNPITESNNMTITTDNSLITTHNETITTGQESEFVALTSNNAGNNGAITMQEQIRLLTERVVALESRVFDNNINNANSTNNVITLLSPQPITTNNQDNATTATPPGKRYRDWTTYQSKTGAWQIVKRIKGTLHCRSIGRAWDAAKADRIIDSFINPQSTTDNAAVA